MGILLLEPLKVQYTLIESRIGPSRELSKFEQIFNRGSRKLGVIFHHNGVVKTIEWFFLACPYHLANRTKLIALSINWECSKSNRKFAQEFFRSPNFVHFWIGYDILLLMISRHVFATV